MSFFILSFQEHVVFWYRLHLDWITASFGHSTDPGRRFNKTHFSQSLEPTRLDSNIFVSHWHLTGGSAARLPTRQSNFKKIDKLVPNLATTIPYEMWQLTRWPLGYVADILKHDFQIRWQKSSLGACCKIVLGWMPQNLINEKSALVQVMAWCL